MGTSTSWFAVEGASLEQVAHELRLCPRTAALSDPADEQDYLAALLPAGWALFVRRMENDGIVAAAEVLKTLSVGRRVVGCDEESHVMYSASSEWRDGREVWAVIHSSEQALTHLAVRGDPPAGWTDAHDQALALQADAKTSGDDVDHVYEVPLDLANRVAGYRLDSEDDDDLELVSFVAAAPAKPWWRFW